MRKKFYDSRQLMLTFQLTDSFCFSQKFWLGAVIASAFLTELLTIKQIQKWKRF